MTIGISTPSGSCMRSISPACRPSRIVIDTDVNTINIQLALRIKQKGAALEIRRIDLHLQRDKNTLIIQFRMPHPQRFRFFPRMPVEDGEMQAGCSQLRWAAHFSAACRMIFSPIRPNPTSRICGSFPLSIQAVFPGWILVQQLESRPLIHVERDDPCIGIRLVQAILM